MYALYDDYSFTTVGCLAKKLFISIRHLNLSTFNVLSTTCEASLPPSRSSLKMIILVGCGLCEVRCLIYWVGDQFKCEDHLHFLINSNSWSETEDLNKFKYFKIQQTQHWHGYRTLPCVQNWSCSDCRVPQEKQILFLKGFWQHSTRFVKCPIVLMI